MLAIVPIDCNALVPGNIKRMFTSQRIYLTNCGTLFVGIKKLNYTDFSQTAFMPCHWGIRKSHTKSVVEKKIADVNDLNHLTFKRKQTDKIRNIYMKELLSSKVKSAVEKKNVSDLKHITLDRKQFDKIRNIHRNWYLFSIKALLSQMAKELLTTAPSDCAKELKECLKQIKYSKDITETARCLTKAKESQEELTLTTRFETSTKKRTMRFWLKNVTRLDFERLTEALRPIKSL
ncbi:hypothetical protein KIN20_025210 [Parelaphostrongylus tenuis]|uniref:Uncharacterized protein n=1 Tax=Parelaphostrongylus tenuis TaxID=148309 RepID=A0AAD5QXR0_PARTN|nr:hypothetical protein KIN20_025210 [Parelaphostrongylus tenuis]